MTTGAQLPARVHGRVLLSSPEAGVTVRARHVQLPQISSERGGGWRTVARQHDRPLTTWDGYDALTMQLVVLLDGWVAGKSVRADLARLRTLAHRLDHQPRPPWVRAIGAVPYQGTRWVIQTLQVEEQLHLGGELVRAQATITLLEWVSPEIRLRVEKPRKTTKQRVHRWQAGDTLHKLAGRYLGTSRRWPDIRAANPQIKHWSQVKVGTPIKIPVA